MSTAAVIALKVIACVVVAYFLGTFNASYILGKRFKKKDVRDYGSHNPGSTNAIRTFGAKFGFLCMAVDILKGALSVLLARLIMWNSVDKGSTLIVIELACGIVCMLGHMYPFYLHWKGGKGIAASLGVLLAVDWRVFLMAGIPALIILAIFRIMSVASLSFETLIFIFYIVMYNGNRLNWAIILLALVYPILAYYGHRGNLKRLFHGEEPRLWGKGSPKDLAAKKAAEEAANGAGNEAAEAGSPDDPKSDVK